MSLHVKNERPLRRFFFFPSVQFFLSSHQPVIVIKNFSFFVEKNVRWLVAPVLKLDLFKSYSKKKFARLLLKIDLIGV